MKKYIFTALISRNRNTLIFHSIWLKESEHYQRNLFLKRWILKGEIASCVTLPTISAIWCSAIRASYGRIIHAPALPSQ